MISILFIDTGLRKRIQHNGRTRAIHADKKNMCFYIVQVERETEKKGEINNLILHVDIFPFMHFLSGASKHVVHTHIYTLYDHCGAHQVR